MKYSYTRSIMAGPKYRVPPKHIEDAVYSEAIIASDRGNPYIEALPEILNDEEIRKWYYTPFPFKPSIDASEGVQRSEIQMLRQIRLPLPFMPDVEKTFRFSLVESYRARFKTMTDYPATAVMQDGMVSQAASFRAAGGADTGIGLTLLGIGGCGKSETVERMLSRYPQVILHKWDSGEFAQIVWVRTVTPANANLADLYTAIAASIDEALGNMIPVYASEIQKLKTVGLKANYIATLIRLFGIGSIILDEIQNLDYGRNRESSFDSLMTIINTTKISLVVIGTDDAFQMFFRKHYIARRAGEIINASTYCVDEKQFEVMMRFICQINWFREPFVMDDGLIRTLYEETNGVIDRMISLWIEVNNAYVSAREKPEITSEFIRRISNKGRPLMAAYTRQKIEESVLISNLMDRLDSGDSIEAVASSMRQDSIRKLLGDTDRPALAENIFSKVKDNLITAGRSYNDTTILKTVQSVLKQKSSQELDEFTLIQKTLKKLDRTKSDKRPAARQLDYNPEEFIQNFIKQ